MGKEKSKKGKLSLFLAVILMLSVFVGCSNNNAVNNAEPAAKKETAAEVTQEPAPLEMLEYSFYKESDDPPKFDNNPDDVLTPIVEDMFKVRVSKVLYNQGATFKERFNMLLATSDLPDVIFAQSNAAIVASSGQYAELGSLIEQYMPNLIEYAPKETWRDALFDGKMYSVPSVWVDTSQDKYKDDLYSLPNANWGLLIREDILDMLGYKYTPLKELEKKINNTQAKPTKDDFKIEPEIKTPEDLYQFLKKVKELNLKVGDKNIIPLSIPWWAQHHLANMYGAASGWQYHPEDDSVTGAMFGDKHSKEYFQYLNKLYNENLLDQEFSIQKDEQLKEKQASGQVAVAMVLLDPAGANTGIQSIAPGKMFHPIPMPTLEGVQKNGIDAFNPVTFQYFVKKDFKDIPRLLQYFDWFYSDESLDLKIWGPESLGLWEMKDGKKVFKDEALHQALLDNVDGSIADAQYYNKGLGRVDSKAFSKAYASAPVPLGYNPSDWQRSYTFTVQDMFSFAQAYVTTAALERDGKLIGGVDEATNTPSNWLWSDFYNKKAADLYATKPADFDKNWDKLSSEFMSKTKYEEAKAKMEQVFKDRGLMK